MRLAMDAIAQAAGGAPSTPAPTGPLPAAPPVSPAPALSQPVPSVPASPPAVAPGAGVTPPALAPEVEPGPPPPAAPSALPADPATRAEGEAPPPGATTSGVNRHTSRADEKLEKALRYLIDINEAADQRSQKWCITEGLLSDLTGCFRPTVKRFAAAHREQIEELNRRDGLGLGHNRGRSRMRRKDLPELINTFRESVLNPSGVEQPF
jgi:hypothetical protein